jgi:hypothetical protein
MKHQLVSSALFKGVDVCGKDFDTLVESFKVCSLFVS